MRPASLTNQSLIIQLKCDPWEHFPLQENGKLYSMNLCDLLEALSIVSSAKSSISGGKKVVSRNSRINLTPKGYLQSEHI